LCVINSQELAIIVEGKFDPVHVSTRTGDYFVLETSIEVSGGILTDLHSVHVFPPKLNGDLSPGFGYFTFRKFELRGAFIEQRKAQCNAR
jgi:hypothetical protein